MGPHVCASDGELRRLLSPGPDRTSLEQLAVEQQIADRVVFTGFIDPDQVMLWHSLADVFVLPSSE